MTTNEIKARCEQIVHNEYDWRANNDLGWLTAQIALAYREALAKGLEMAAVTLEQMYDESSDREVVFYEALLTGAVKCRGQANTLKETPCDTSQSKDCVEGR